MGDETAQALVGYDRVLELTSSIRSNYASGTFSTLSTISPPACEIPSIDPPSSQLPLDASAILLLDAPICSPPKLLRKALFCLGLIQILVGELLLILNILTIKSSLAHYHRWVSVGFVTIGIIGGFFTVIVGSLASLVSCRATACRLIACPVLPILAAISAGAEIIMTVISIASDARGEFYFGRTGDRVADSTSHWLIGWAMALALSLANVAISIAVASLMCYSVYSRCSGAGFANGKAVGIALRAENVEDIIAQNEVGQWWLNKE